MKLTSWLPLALLAPLSLAAQVPAPSGTVTINVQANTVVRTVDPRFYGANLITFDAGLTTPAILPLLQAADFNSFRFPGGGWSDDYNWATDTQVTATTPTKLPNSLSVFATLAASQGAHAYVTVNYGSGTPEEAAAEVAYLNAAPSSPVVIGVDAKGVDWKTAGYWATIRAASPLGVDDGYNFLRIGRTAGFGFTTFEVGNELYTQGEIDQHGAANSGLTGTAHDPYTYAQAFQVFKTKMQAVDPTVRLGAILIVSEDAGGIGTHAVTNPRTHVSHTGWDAVLMGTLNTEGVIPDFVSIQYFAQAAGSESDNTLLQKTPTFGAAAGIVRQELTDYLGASPSSSVELAITEINSVASNPGKQTTNLVNGLFYADAYGALAQTEVKTAIWWNFQFGDTSSLNNESASLYGWRDFGSYNMVGDVAFAQAFPDNTPFPTYYAAKLLLHWARGGDSILPTTSSYAWLSAYGAKQADGSLALLVINKNPTLDVAANIAIAGYTATSSNAIVYSYGKANDAQFSTTPDVTSTNITNAGATFTYTFPSYSMSVIRLTSTAAPTSKLVNLSTRSLVQSGANVQIAGFVITGTGQKTVLIRANGPFLTKQGVPGVLADPTLALVKINSGGVAPTPIATNDNWGDDPAAKVQISTTAAAVGAPAWDDGSKDAAILTTLDPGLYTATVASKDASQGVALVEVFEVDVSNAASRLVNVSTRSAVGTGGNVQIAGFVISGTGSKKVIIRANGPALTPLGVPGALADPMLQIYANGNVIATNDNWDSSNQADFAKVGASPWTAGSKDAAIVTTLPAGAYTAIVSGVGSTSGVSLVEVYEEQ